MAKHHNQGNLEKKTFHWLVVLEGSSPQWQSKGMVPGTAEGTHLDPQTRGKERGTLGVWCEP